MTQDHEQMPAKRLTPRRRIQGSGPREAAQGKRPRGCGPGEAAREEAVLRKQTHRGNPRRVQEMRCPKAKHRHTSHSLSSPNACHRYYRATCNLCRLTERSLNRSGDAGFSLVALWLISLTDTARDPAPASPNHHVFS